MASRPEHATGADYARLGVPATDEQVSEARDRARQALAEKDARWTDDRWTELDRLTAAR